MASHDISRRASRPWIAVLLALPLALLLGASIFWSRAETEGRALELGEATEAKTVPAPVAPPRDVGDERVGPQDAARAALPLELAPSSEATQDGDVLRFRFVRGSTGKPLPDLAVRLFEGPEGEPSLLAEGRTDAHGLLLGPGSLREHHFAFELDPVGSSARTTLPAAFGPETLPRDDAWIEVRVLGAWAGFEALVLDLEGRPAAGAIVQFDFESPALAFSTHDAPSTRLATDAAGIARLELVDPGSAGGRLRVKAEAGELHSETVELPPPLSATRVELRLSTSAGAIVHARDAHGAPLAGAMARVERLDPPFASSGRSTDREGTAKFSVLEPGRYAASIDDPATRTSARAEFQIARCQIAEVRLDLPASDLPLAVSGGVRDAEGKPLSWMRVSICVDGREEARLALDAAGRFAYHREPCERLRVRVQASFDGPLVEPEVVDAPFGTKDLAFVLGDAPKLGFAALRIVDRETGEGIGGVAAAVFRDSAVERIGGVVSAFAGSALSLASNEEGLLFVPSGARLPRARLLVEKRGYVRRELDLADVASLAVRDGRPTLELARGYVHRWIVLDARTGLPISGAIATHGVDPFTGLSIDDGSTWLPSAPSDARGVLELSLPQAPSRVSIQARGYVPRAVEAGAPSQVQAAALATSDAVLLEAETRR